jgi:alpha-beta hydrolase superfamily lysophospholipase
MAPRACAPRLERWLAGRGARLERVRYARPQAGGEVSAYRLVPRDPSARAVVVHGAGNDALYPQAALFRALVSRGVEVFSFDVDGHGAESTTVFSGDAVRGAISAAVAEAERGGEDLPLHLIGHSLGGSLVLDALVTRFVPHAASAIVLSSPVSVHLDLRVALAELRGFFRRATLGQRVHYGLWGMVPAVGPLKRRAYPIRGAAEAGRSFAYVAAVQRLLREMDLARSAEEIGVPVLLVYGGADRLVPPEQGRRLAERIPSAEFVEVSGASHWSTVFAPETLAQTVDWIVRHTAVRA